MEFRNRVIIGNGCKDHEPTRGWVAAFDSATGKEAWKFYIVLVKKGELAWYNGCHGCHGIGAVSGGMAPDLRASPLVLNQEVFVQAVRGASRVVRAMPAHKDLSDTDLEALQHFIRQAARSAIEDNTD